MHTEPRGGTAKKIATTHHIVINVEEKCVFHSQWMSSLLSIEPPDEYPHTVNIITKLFYFYIYNQRHQHQFRDQLESPSKQLESIISINLQHLVSTPPTPKSTIKSAQDPATVFAVDKLQNPSAYQTNA